MPWMPMLLICCEGKTEEQYFKILARVFRLPNARISIIGEIGQHRALIERTAEKRQELCKEFGLAEQEVECWAVCDDDNMPISYKELSDYAREHGVHLAFSRPQFEAYLLQHFEQSGEQNARKIIASLTERRKAFDGEPYDKAHLKWLEAAIDRKPSIIDMAIVNADLRGKQSGNLFLTVQELAKRMRELGR